MANLIIHNPTDRQIEEARLLHKIKTDPLFHEKVNTSVSARMYEKKKREQALTPREISKIKFIPWDTVAQKLTSLNKTIMFTNLPDAKVGIGFRTPSRKEVADWEKAILSPSERAEVMRLGNHNGPRPFLVSASRGFVAPYTRILTSSYPQQIVCRSLKGICRVLIAHGGFTWGEAERAFGFKLLGPGTEEVSEHIAATPQAWASDRPVVRAD